MKRSRPTLAMLLAATLTFTTVCPAFAAEGSVEAGNAQTASAATEELVTYEMAEEPDGVGMDADPDQGPVSEADNDESGNTEEVDSTVVQETDEDSAAEEAVEDEEITDTEQESGDNPEWEEESQESTAGLESEQESGGDPEWEEESQESTAGLESEQESGGDPEWEEEIQESTAGLESEQEPGGDPEWEEEIQESTTVLESEQESGDNPEWEEEIQESTTVLESEQEPGGDADSGEENPESTEAAGNDSTTLPESEETIAEETVEESIMEPAQDSGSLEMKLSTAQPIALDELVTVDPRNPQLYLFKAPYAGLFSIQGTIVDYAMKDTSYDASTSGFTGVDVYKPDGTILQRSNWIVLHDFGSKSLTNASPYDFFATEGEEFCFLPKAEHYYNWNGESFTFCITSNGEGELTPGNPYMLKADGQTRLFYFTPSQDSIYRFSMKKERSTVEMKGEIEIHEIDNVAHSFYSDEIRLYANYNSEYTDVYKNLGYCHVKVKGGTTYYVRMYAYIEDDPGTDVEVRTEVFDTNHTFTYSDSDGQWTVTPGEVSSEYIAQQYDYSELTQREIWHDSAVRQYVDFNSLVKLKIGWNYPGEETPKLKWELYKPGNVNGSADTTISGEYDNYSFRANALLDGIEEKYHYYRVEVRDTNGSYYVTPVTFYVYVNPHQHSWSNWTVKKQPTTTENGIKTRTCSECGVVQSNSIPKKTVVKYTIKFDKANSSAKLTATPLQVEAGKAYGTLPNPTLPGYYFQGWYTEKKGGTKVTTKTKPSKSMTLYAHWVERRSLKKAKITVGSCTYNTKALKPKVTVKYGSKTLKEGTDYTLVLANNKNASRKAAVTVKGKNVYKDSVKKAFTINQRDISKSPVTIKLKKTKYGYTGKAVKPGYTAVISVGGKNVNLVNGTDFKIAYKNNIKIGTASIVFTGKGNCKGTKTIRFYILKKATVTLNLNKGSNSRVTPVLPKGSKNTVEILAGEKIGKIPTPTRKGYTFVGWFTTPKATGGTQIKPEKTRFDAGETKNQTIYARWKRDTYKITFKYDKNGLGINCPFTLPKAMTYNVEKAVTLPILTSKYAKFNGWKTTPNAVTSDKLIKKIGEKATSGDRVLYLDYRNYEYSIVFSGSEGGSVSNGTKHCITCSSKDTLPKAVFTPPTGKTFDKWYCTENGQYYQDGAEFERLTTEDGKVFHFVAVWKLKYDINGTVDYAVSKAADLYSSGILCAGFVSRCIINGGRFPGFAIKETVGDLADELTRNGFVQYNIVNNGTSIYTKDSESNGKISVGDVIIYYCTSEDHPKNGAEFYHWMHAALVTYIDPKNGQVYVTDTNKGGKAWVNDKLAAQYNDGIHGYQSTKLIYYLYHFEK